ncbi:hypothetical protein N2152v2_005943 [Parachlorella kessleri]
MTEWQRSLPQKFQEALASQSCREDRQDFLADLVQQEAIPKVNPDQRTVFMHVGANRGQLARRLGDDFQSVHIAEPNTFLLPPDMDELETLAVHTEDIMSVHFTGAGHVPEHFALVIVDNLLQSLAISPARNNPEVYLQRIVGDLLQDGGIALLGTLAPRGPLHEFLSAINPAYVGSAAIQSILQAMPNLQHWVVERSNVAALPSKALLEQLLELHAFLVQPEEGADVAQQQPALGGAEGSQAAEPAGPQAGGAARQAAPLADLVARFVAQADNGAGKWNWVEEDDYILVQKLPMPDGGKQ